MPEDKAYTSSRLIKDYKYEPNINTIEESGQTTDLYKVRVHFNDLNYDLCIAIGNVKEMDNVDYKYVYAVKYGKVVSKLGVYEFVHGGNTDDYKEGSMLLFDNFASTYKLDDLKQTKDEYIVNTVETHKFLRTIKRVILESKEPVYEKKYGKLIKLIEGKSNKDMLLKTLKFYDELNKTIDIRTVEFIKDGTLDHALVDKYKTSYDSMSYNDFICMIFAIDFELLDELDEFEEKPTYSKEPSESPSEATESNVSSEATESNVDPNEEEEEEEEEEEAEEEEEQEEAEETLPPEPSELSAPAPSKVSAPAPSKVSAPAPSKVSAPAPSKVSAPVTSELSSKRLEANSEKSNVGGQMKMKLLKRKMKL
jgi:hypothetical protein